MFWLVLPANRTKVIKVDSLLRKKQVFKTMVAIFREHCAAIALPEINVQSLEEIRLIRQHCSPFEMGHN